MTALADIVKRGERFELRDAELCTWVAAEQEGQPAARDSEGAAREATRIDALGSERKAREAEREARQTERRVLRACMEEEMRRKDSQQKAR